jgi:hypothetical protein
MNAVVCEVRLYADTDIDVSVEEETDTLLLTK